MDSQNIDRAIENLSDDEYKRLIDRAISHWWFRFNRWPIVVSFAAAVLACMFAFRWLAGSFWPGSYLAMGLAVVAWFVVMLYGMNRLLSLEFSQWRVACAVRREFMRSRRCAP